MLISDTLASMVLEEALSKGADFAELFAERTSKSTMKVKDDELESLDSGTLFGLGLRLIKGTEQVYLHTNDISENTLLRLAREASSALGKGEKRFSPKPFKEISPNNAPEKATPRQEKLAFLK